MTKIQRIRDPLHNLVLFGNQKRLKELDKVLWKVVNSRPLQRLRQIKQLGFSDIVYPGASHSRFAHSLGAMQTARQLIEIIQRHPQTSRIEEEFKAIIAALVHDVGHGPFSHAFEEVGKLRRFRWPNHEDRGEKIILNGEIAEILGEFGGEYVSGVADMIKKEKLHSSMHSAVVSSQFDADRLDYMRRDRLMTGCGHSAVDFPWLLENLRIEDVSTGVDEEDYGTVPTFVIGPKAIHAVETYILDLFQLYPTVYLHKTTRGAVKIFVELFARLIDEIRDNRAQEVGLPEEHPLVLFAKDPENLERFLSLDDTVISGAIPQLRNSKDPLISEFARRLQDRKLYKCIDIRALVQDEINPENKKSLVEVVDKTCIDIRGRLDEIREENKKSSPVPRILIDETSRSAYQKSGEGKDLQNRIHIMTNRGEPEDLSKHSEVVAGIEVFKVLRAYYPDGPDGTASKTAINNTIKEFLK